MTRNLNPVILRNSNNETEIARMLSEPNITAFQYRMDSFSFPGGSDSPNYGIHGGFHLAVGGQMADVFGSPADPVFWLHHGMIDNLWTKWQAMDPPNRQYALNGTNVLKNPPGSTEITVDFEQSFGYLDKTQRIGHLMDVSKGPFCYGYV